MSELTSVQLWWIALGVGVVVEVVVWVLLHRIVSSAGRIRDTLVEIWVVGPRIANNTAHIDVLRYINRTAGDVLAAAKGIAEGAARIHEHANGCPGCPQCVIGWGGAGGRGPRGAGGGPAGGGSSGGSTPPTGPETGPAIP